MKKLILTAVLAMGILFVSAQSLMVVTDLIKTADGEEFGVENITDRMGIGYQVNDKLVIGLQGSTGEDGFDLFVRYLWKEAIYASLSMPTEDATDNMNIGIGYSFNVWNSLYIEPNYNMQVSEDDSGDRKGDFNLGLSYRF